MGGRWNQEDNRDAQGAADDGAGREQSCGLVSRNETQWHLFVPSKAVARVLIALCHLKLNDVAELSGGTVGPRRYELVRIGVFIDEGCQEGAYSRQDFVRRVDVDAPCALPALQQANAALDSQAGDVNVKASCNIHRFCFSNSAAKPHRRLRRCALCAPPRLTNDDLSLVIVEVVLGHLEVEGRRALPRASTRVVVRSVAGAEPVRVRRRREMSKRRGE